VLQFDIFVLAMDTRSIQYRAVPNTSFASWFATQMRAVFSADAVTALAFINGSALQIAT
jgi:hypothetical protein